VDWANKTELTTPERTSFPSIFSPLATPIFSSNGLPCISTDAKIPDRQDIESSWRQRWPRPAGDFSTWPESKRQRHRNQQQSSISRKSVSGVGFSNGWAEIGIEKAAAVGADFLNGFLRGNRTDRYDLFAAFQCLSGYGTLNVCTTPCETSNSDQIMATGSST